MRIAATLAMTATLSICALAVAQHEHAHPAGDAAAAQAAIDRTIKAYSALNTYSDRASVRFELKGTGAGEDLNEDSTEVFEFTFARPRSFVLSNKGNMPLSFHSDGKEITTHEPTGHEYMVHTVGESFDWEQAAGPMGSMIEMNHPVAALLTSAPKSGTGFPMLEQAASAAPEARNDRPGTRVTGTASFDALAEGTLVPATVWIDDATGLVGEIALDITAAYQKLMDEMAGQLPEGQQFKVEKMAMTIAFEDARPNPEVPADAFAFKPGPDDKKVEELSIFADPMAGQPDPQQDLVGKPAPAWAGKDLDGKAISLADYKGKIVVMDFWATWCPPCVQSMPHLQKLSETYADKGVVVIGMNHDGPGDEPKIRSFMEKNGITFRQCLDHDGAIGSAYLVSGIPCTVFIDKQGVIQAIHVGFAPGQEEQYAATLDKLVKGESPIGHKHAGDK